MRAIQYREPGRPELVDVPMPDVPEGEVLVKVKAVTTCPHWDLHINEGIPMVPGMELNYPFTLGQPGHEAAGEVVALGKGVTRFKEGDSVALWRDQGMARQGCYAEYVPAKESSLIPVPGDIEPSALASLELAMCVQASFQQILGILPVEGTRFAVNGLGPGGLVAIQIARAYGAGELIAFDPVESRRELAQKIGVDRALDPMDPDAFPEGRRKPDAIDIALDCTGLAPAVEYLMDRTHRLVALFGVLREPVRFGLKHWHPGLNLMGYGQHSYEAAEAALGHVVAGKLNLSHLVSETLPFERYAEGVQLLKEKKAIKVCFVP
jgi:threonine dehydrogenase-like Zn-dependent dehydrogenase